MLYLRTHNPILNCRDKKPESYQLFNNIGVQNLTSNLKEVTQTVLGCGEYLDHAQRRDDNT